MFTERKVSYSQCEKNDVIQGTSYLGKNDVTWGQQWHVTQPKSKLPPLNYHWCQCWHPVIPLACQKTNKLGKTSCHPAWQPAWQPTCKPTCKPTCQPTCQQASLLASPLASPLAGRLAHRYKNIFPHSIKTVLLPSIRKFWKCLTWTNDPAYYGSPMTKKIVLELRLMDDR